MRKIRLAIASSGKVKYEQGHLQVEQHQDHHDPEQGQVLEKSVATPSLRTWLSASMSLVIREIRTPGRLRVKKPIDIACRW
jgi:hypothetical protein